MGIGKTAPVQNQPKIVIDTRENPDVVDLREDRASTLLLTMDPEGNNPTHQSLWKTDRVSGCLLLATTGAVVATTVVIEGILYKQYQMGQDKGLSLAVGGFALFAPVLSVKLALEAFPVCFNNSGGKTGSNGGPEPSAPPPPLLPPAIALPVPAGEEGAEEIEKAARVILVGGALLGLLKVVSALGAGSACAATGVGAPAVPACAAAGFAIAP